MIIFIILTKKRRKEQKLKTEVVRSITMHVCIECGNVVGSHHEELSVLLSALWFYTIHNTLHLHLLIAHLDNIEWATCCTWDTCPDLSHVCWVATCGARQQVGGDCTRDTGPTTAWGRGRPVSLAPAIILHTPLKYFPLNIQIFFTSW